MTTIVLLARSHPFIVAEIKPFLKHARYATAKLENLADLATQTSSGAGVVISLAVPSSLGESAVEVFTQTRQGLHVLLSYLLPCCRWIRFGVFWIGLQNMPVFRRRSLVSLQEMKTRQRSGSRKPFCISARTIYRTQCGGRLQRGRSGGIFAKLAIG